MRGYKNPVIAEKPDHAHYPACLGRLEAINKKGFQLFLYTIAAGFGLAALSLLGHPLQVVGWLPALIEQNTEDITVGMSFLQMFISISLVVMGGLGCGKRKLFHVILLAVYLLMFVCPMFWRFSYCDIMVMILGGGGVIFGSTAFSDFLDYSQLSKTEGFPQFSIILTEHDEKKAMRDNFNRWYSERQKTAAQQKPEDISAATDSGAFPQSQQKAGPAPGMGDMPEISMQNNVRGNVPPDRFRTRSGKAKRISDSGMKFR